MSGAIDAVAPQTPATEPAAPPAAAGTLAGDAPARAVGAVALASLALIHVEDLPDTWGDSTLVGSAFVALIAVSLVLAAALLARPAWATRLWLAVGAVGAGAMVAYVLSRTSGIPGDDDDIGNWRCSLGLATLTVEALIMVLAAWVVSERRRS